MERDLLWMLCCLLISLLAALPQCSPPRQLYSQLGWEASYVEPYYVPERLGPWHMDYDGMYCIKRRKTWEGTLLSIHMRSNIVNLFSINTSRERNKIISAPGSHVHLDLGVVVRLEVIQERSGGHVTCQDLLVRRSGDEGILIWSLPNNSAWTWGGPFLLLVLTSPNVLSDPRVYFANFDCFGQGYNEARCILTSCFHGHGVYRMMTDV